MNIKKLAFCLSTACLAFYTNMASAQIIANNGRLSTGWDWVTTSQECIDLGGFPGQRCTMHQKLTNGSQSAASRTLLGGFCSRITATNGFYLIRNGSKVRQVTNQHTYCQNPTVTSD